MASPSNDINKDLLLRVAGGDEKAFRKLFELYEQKVYTIAFHITRSKSGAEELLQDVFLTIWLKREQLPQIENFESYFFIVTRNEAYRAFKKTLIEKEKIESDSGLVVFNPETDEPLSIHESKDLIQKALLHLSPQQRQVYLLLKEQGLTREEAAEVLKVEPETIKTHLKRAMRTLRAFCIANLKILLFMALIR